MLPKKQMTIEGFYEFGAYFLIAKQIYSKLSTLTAQYLGVRQLDRMIKVYNIVQETSFLGEEKMFSLFPDLPKDYLSVFSMNLTSEPNHDVQKEMQRRASDILERMCYKDDE